MSGNKNQTQRTKIVVAVLFGISVTGLLWFNWKSANQIRVEKQNQKSLSLELERENKTLEEFKYLDSANRKISAEYRMMDLDLKTHYSSKCHQLEDFIPVANDRIVTTVFKDTEDVRTNAIFSVPETGKHRLRVEAKKLWSTAPQRFPEQNEEIIFSKSYDLEPGRAYRSNIMISASGSAVKATLSGHEEIEIKFPFGLIDREIVFDKNDSHERVVSSPNQVFISPYKQQQKKCQSFADAVFASTSAANGQKTFSLNRKSMQVLLYIDSDGPKTGMADDPVLVRSLLKEYDKGIEPKFTFNETTQLYEFENRINPPTIGQVLAPQPTPQRAQRLR